MPLCNSACCARAVDDIVETGKLPEAQGIIWDFGFSDACCDSVCNSANLIATAASIPPPDIQWVGLENLEAFTSTSPKFSRWPLAPPCIREAKHITPKAVTTGQCGSCGSGSVPSGAQLGACRA